MASIGDEDTLEQCNARMAAIRQRLNENIIQTTRILQNKPPATAPKALSPGDKLRYLSAISTATATDLHKAIHEIA